jgi:hypothetical protein
VLITKSASEFEIPEIKKGKIVTLLRKDNNRSKICASKKYWNKSTTLTM